MAIDVSLGSSLASQRLSLAHRKAAYFIRARKHKEPECVSKTEVTDFNCNFNITLISKLKSHHSCHVLFIRSKPLNLTHTKRKKVQKDVNIWRQGFLEVVLEASYHIFLFATPFSISPQISHA